MVTKAGSSWDELILFKREAELVIMTDLMKQLAALPVGEKLRMLEEMVAATKSITASQPPRPLNALRMARRA